MKLIKQDFVEGLHELKKDFPFFDIERAGQFIDEALLTQPAFPKVNYFKQAWMRQVLSQTNATTKESSIKDLAFMIDCSRNAVVKVSTLKQWIRQLVVLGYNTFMLYLEDVFEVDHEPYFGYLRGRYSKEELKEVVRYASLFGIEVVPCIQTLAHYNQLVRWYEHLQTFDIADILLVGSPRANALLDHIFATLRECFTTDRLNVGMDEAHLIGRGKYYDQHGAVDRFSIMKQQLDLVDTLSKKYQFKPMMWSDMFFRLANDSYYESNQGLPHEVNALVKDRFDLVYWDYYHVDSKHYQTMLDIHKAIDTKIYFAGGAWKWSGFTPDNRYSITTLLASMKVMKEANVPLYMITGWADNGAESSQFSILPSIVTASLYRDEYQPISQGENEIMTALTGGLSHEDFMFIDSANRAFVADFSDRTNTTNKSLLFNDPLLGVMDSLATFIDPKLYHCFVKKMSEPKFFAHRYSYLFKTQLSLLKLLEHKADFGLRLRKAYQQKELETLHELNKEVDLMMTLLDDFSSALSTQWHLENKPHGFDVQDLRLGGLHQRLVATQTKLTAYLAGDIPEIDELNEEILDYMCQGKEYTFDSHNCEYRMHRITSVNVND